MLFTERQIQEKPTVKLGNDNLEYVEENKFLGLIFDQHLTWKPHINFLKRTCTKLHDLLKVLTHHSWGGDTVILLLVYKMIIRSSIDYEPIVYSTCKKYLAPICTIQNTALKLALGAFRTSSVSNLHCLANELPIIDRLHYLRLKILSTKDNFVTYPASLRHFLTPLLQTLLGSILHCRSIPLRLSTKQTPYHIPSFRRSTEP